MRKQRSLTDLGAVLLVLGGAASCSFLYNLDQVQCEVISDCYGAGFPSGTKCVDNICVAPSIGDGGTSSNTPTNTTGGGTTSTGGTGSGGTSSTDVGGSNNGGTSSTTNTSNNSTTGTAGAGGMPECSDNEDCIDQNKGNPAICRDSTCIPLADETVCPVVLGAGDDLEFLKNYDPIIIGAYSYINPLVPEESAPTANYRLAIEEVNNRYPGGSKRPFIAVVCDAYNDVPISMDHLINKLQVPAMLSSLYTSDLKSSFETYGQSPYNVFFMSPLEADSTLTDPELDTRGLLWHMLPEAVDLAEAYTPLIARTEVLVRERASIPSDPIRVAMIVLDEPFLEDIANVITAKAKFNGKSVGENLQDDNFLRINITATDTGNTLQQIQQFRPHIILAMTYSEFNSQPVLQGIENSWPTLVNLNGQPPPFYVLSPYMIGLKSGLDRAAQYENPPGGDYPGFLPLRERELGINFSGAEDKTLYNAYLPNLLADNPGATYVLEGSENFYDATYFLMYSVVAAGNVPKLRGTDIAAGMLRLLGPSPDEYDVGPLDVTRATGFLRANPDDLIELYGTMGPPDFNTGSGARRGRFSLWCVDDLGDGMEYVTDTMIYDPDTNMLVGDDGPCSVDDFTAEDP